MTNGGRRPGAGPKKGQKRGKYQKTLDKEAAREVARQIIMRSMEPLIEAQVANALGLSYLVVRDKKTGKFIRVTEGGARAQVSSGEDLLEVWEKEPCVQAFTDLMNRALDKPKEQLQEMHVTVTDAEIAKLDRAKQRARGEAVTHS